MSDFQFIKNPRIEQWVILAPRRAKRPDPLHHMENLCPFCVGNEKPEEEVFRVSSPRLVIPDDSSVIPDSIEDPALRQAPIQSGQAQGENMDSRLRGNDREGVNDRGGWPASNASRSDAGWEVRVVNNKFPFASIHEIVIHSPDHHKNFDELPLSQDELIMHVFRQRFQIHQGKGQVVIFSNHGEAGGESLPHPHTQIAVVPEEVELQTSPLLEPDGQTHETDYFTLFCPKVSQWPDETWIAPKRRDKTFAEVEDEELSNLALVLKRLIQIMDMRHGHEFPFNFYIYPGKDWYLRLIPRVKSLGGFEMATNIVVNTQSPTDSINFIKAHFDNPDFEKIQQEMRAEYAKGV